jgi:CBS domain-containing protein
MRIDAILRRKDHALVTCRSEDTIDAAAALLYTSHIGAMPVRNREGELVGVISERDIMSGFAVHGSYVQDLRVGELMTRDVVTCAPSDDMTEAMEVMRQHSIRHLPVLADGKLIGMISLRDMLVARLEETTLEVRVLRDSVIAARHA